MAERLGSALLELGTKGKGKTNRDIDQVHKGAKRLDTGFKAVTSSLAKFGLAMSAVALVAFTKRLLETVNVLQDTADKLGLTTDALQEYRFAAAQVGVNQRTLDNAIQRFTRRLGEAAAGEGVLKDTLLQYNIAIFDSNKQTRAAEDVLNDFADAIQKAGGRSEQLRLVIKAFDIEGGPLVNLLDQGAEGLDKFREAARKAGGVLDRETIAKLSEANRVLTVFGIQFRVWSAKAILAIEPVIKELSNLLEKLGEIKRQAPDSLGVLEFGFKSIVAGIKTVNEGLLLTGKTIAAFAATFVAPTVDAAKGILKAWLADVKKDFAEFVQSVDRLMADKKAGATPRPRQTGAGAGAAGAVGDVATLEAKSKALAAVIDDLRARREAADIEAWERGQERARAKGDLTVKLSRGIALTEEREQDRLKARAEEISNSLQSIFQQAMEGTLTAGKLASTILASIAKQLADSIAKSLVQIQSGQTIKPGTGGITGLGGLIVGGLKGLFSFQHGSNGPVPGPVGKPQVAIVHGGEHVLTSKQAAEGGTGKNIYNIDARNAQQGVSAEIMRAIRMGDNQAVVRAVSTVTDQRQRGGGFAHVFEGG